MQAETIASRLLRRECLTSLHDACSAVASSAAPATVTATSQPVPSSLLPQPQLPALAPQPPPAATLEATTLPTASCQAPIVSSPSAAASLFSPTYSVQQQLALLDAHLASALQAEQERTQSVLQRCQQRVTQGAALADELRAALEQQHQQRTTEQTSRAVEAARQQREAAEADLHAMLDSWQRRGEQAEARLQQMEQREQLREQQREQKREEERQQQERRQQEEQKVREQTVRALEAARAEWHIAAEQLRAEERGWQLRSEEAKDSRLRQLQDRLSQTEQEKEEAVCKLQQEAAVQQSALATLHADMQSMRAEQRKLEDEMQREQSEKQQAAAALAAQLRAEARDWQRRGEEAGVRQQQGERRWEEQRQLLLEREAELLQQVEDAQRQLRSVKERLHRLLHRWREEKQDKRRKQAEHQSKKLQRGGEQAAAQAQQQDSQPPKPAGRARGSSSGQAGAGRGAGCVAALLGGRGCGAARLNASQVLDGAGPQQRHRRAAAEADTSSGGQRAGQHALVMRPRSLPCCGSGMQSTLLAHGLRQRSEACVPCLRCLTVRCRARAPRLGCEAAACRIRPLFQQQLHSQCRWRRRRHCSSSRSPSQWQSPQ